MHRQPPERTSGRRRTPIAVLLSLALAAALLVAGSAPPASADACTRTWVGGDGTWADVDFGTDTSFWSPDTAANETPNSLDVVCLPAGNYTVTILGSQAQVGEMVIGDNLGGPQPKVVAARSLMVSPSAPRNGQLQNFGTIELTAETANSSTNLQQGGPGSIVNHGTIRILEGPGGAINQRFLGTNGGLTNHGTIQSASTNALFSGPATQSASGTIDVDAGATLDMSSNNKDLDGTLQIDGTLTGLSGMTVRSCLVIAGSQPFKPRGQLTLDNGPESGTIHVDDAFNATVNGTLSAAGTYILGGATANHAQISSGLTNNGTVRLTSTANATSQLSGSNTIVNNGTLELLQGAGGLRSIPNVTNNVGGVVTVTSSQATSGTISTASSVSIPAGGSLTSSSTYTQTAGMTTVDGTLASSGSGVQLQGGLFTGSGTVNVTLGCCSLFTNSGGTVAPGSSPGTLSITGAYTQSAGGTLAVDIAGTGAGQFDRLAVSGTASLAGTVAVNATGGANPFVSVLTAATRTGTFGTVTGVQPADVTYTGTAVNVHVGSIPPPAVKLAIGDASRAEGNTAKTSSQLRITLSDPQTVDTFVTYTVAGTSATANVDYTQPKQAVTKKIPAGKVSTTASISVTGDTATEGDEQVELTITGVTGGDGAIGIVDNKGVLTIRNDDPAGAAAVSIGDTAVHECDAGKVNATVTLVVSQAPVVDTTFTLSTVGTGSAAAGVDYTAKINKTAKIKAGKTSAQFSVVLLCDTSVEGDESFQVQITNGGGFTISDGTAVITIVDDDDNIPA